MRLKVLRVTTEALAALIFSPQWRRTLHADVPPDAEITCIDVESEWDQGVILIYLRHESFPETPNGRNEDVPRIEWPKFETREFAEEKEKTAEQVLAEAEEMAKLPWER